MSNNVQLRPFRQGDLDLFTQMATNPSFSEPFEWFGYRSPAEWLRRFDEDGFLGGGQRMLAVAESDAPALGLVSWKDPTDGRGWAWEIGVFVRPEHRGHGVGTAAHRLFVDYLFDTTTAERLVAFTEVENHAEQSCLEACGFVREGLRRSAVFRAGTWHDDVMYALLRHDIRGGTTQRAP